MNPKQLDYEIILGAKINEEMPEDLKEIITGHIENVVGPQAREELRAKVIQYCKDNGLEVQNIESREYRQDSGIIKVDENGVADDPIADNALSSFFKKLGQKRGIKVENKSKVNSEDIAELQQGIKEITDSLNPDSSDEEKSRAAFKILDLKIKSLKLEYKNSYSRLDDELSYKMKALTARTSNESDLIKEIVAKVDKEFKRTLILVEQASESLDKLGSLDEEEFMKQDFEARGNYLKYMKSEIDKSSTFLKEELAAVKAKLINTLSNKLNLGEHINIVLG